MKIKQLIANNINQLDTELPVDKSLGIAGLSGSGKTTFCQTIGEESKKRLVSLLPKAEYQYLFPNIMETNFSAIKMEEMPLVLFLGKVIHFFESAFNNWHTYWRIYRDSRAAC